MGNLTHIRNKMKIRAEQTVTESHKSTTDKVNSDYFYITKQHTHTHNNGLSL